MSSIWTWNTSYKLSSWVTVNLDYGYAITNIINAPKIAVTNTKLCVLVTTLSIKYKIKLLEQ